MTHPEIVSALTALDDLTRQLRLACPWDREQDERSIVPHTIEEAYELADAALARDDAKLLDELGDVLFQVHFLALLLEERGAGDLAQVAEHCRQKLIRRHPHVFGDAEVSSAGEVLRNWDAIKADEPDREPGIFGEVPENLPALLHARKIQRRSASSGFDVEDVGAALDAARSSFELLDAEVTNAGPGASAAPTAPDRQRELLTRGVGDALFALTSLSRKLKVDPELALRGSTARFRSRVEYAEQLAAAEGLSWPELSADRQFGYYAQAVYGSQENQ